MSRNDTLLAGVAHKFIKPYFQKYLNSASKQKFKKFDLLILNDGLQNIELFIKKKDIQIYQIKSKGGITSNRLKLMNYAIKYNYKNLIFSDFDDEMDKNRIAETVKELKKNKVVVGDLNIIDVDSNIITKKYFSKRVKKELLSKKDILHYNIIGLTNSAIQVKILKKILEKKINKEIIIFDWYFWTMVLNKVKSAKFSSTIVTNYRVHKKNIAGINNDITRDYLKRGLIIKKNHYKNLINYGKEYKKLYLDFVKIIKLSKKSKWMNNYTKKVKDIKIKYPFWWENILNPNYFN